MQYIEVFNCGSIFTLLEIKKIWGRVENLYSHHCKQCMKVVSVSIFKLLKIVLGSKMVHVKNMRFGTKIHS